MLCHSCKTDNRTNARFCRGCGGTLLSLPMPVVSSMQTMAPLMPAPIVQPQLVPAPMMQPPIVTAPQAPAIVVSSGSAPFIVLTSAPQAVAPHPQVQVAPPQAPPPLPAPTPAPTAAPARHVEYSNCPQCRARRRQTDWFCGQCGCKLPASTATLCLKCGCALCDNQRFCHSCGADVASARCG